MRVLLTGGGGQLGFELLRTKPVGIEIFSPNRTLMNLESADIIKQYIFDIKPDWVINSAAFTNLEEAEVKVALVTKINTLAPIVMAHCVKAMGVNMLQLSSDYVFDGCSSTAYSVDATPQPLGQYALSKSNAERTISEILPQKSLIVRTSWLYSVHGHNFVKTILKLCETEQIIRVVDDQIGTPTSAKGLAVAIWKMLNLSCCGIYHWSDEGVASWYDFAVAIQDEAYDIGLIIRKARIIPIKSDAYPSAFKRPAYSVLDKAKNRETIGYSLHWRKALKLMLKELALG